MPSLGEIFVQLGVVGDVKPLEKAIKTIREAIKETNRQISANKRLIRYLNDLKNAQGDAQKKLIKENFAKEILNDKREKELEQNQKVIDGKKELAANIAGVVKGIGAFVGAVSGAVFALNKLSESLIQNNQAWINFTRQTDLSLQSLQKYAGVASLLDASLGQEGAAGTIEQLNKRLFELQLTGQGARGFILAGVNPIGQDAFGVIEQIRNRISGLNNTAATYLLEQMGIDPRMLPLLRMTRQEFEALYSTIEKYQLSKEQREQIQALNTQLSIAGQKLKYLKDKVVLALLPLLVRLAESFAAVTEGIVSFFEWMRKGETLGAKITAVILSFAAAVGVLTAALWAFTAHPIVAAITAALMALYLVIEDIMYYLQGKDSLIGVIINFFKELGKDIDLGNFEAVFDKIKTIAITLSKLPVSPFITSLIRFLELLSMVKTDVFDKLFPDENEEEKEQIGFKETVPADYSKILNPASNIANNTTNNADNRQINQNIQITTSQPAQDINNEIIRANSVFAGGYAG